MGEEGGEVVWDWVVPVTEGNGGCFPEFEKSRLTVQSLIIATEPLGDQIWNRLDVLVQYDFFISKLFLFFLVKYFFRYLIIDNRWIGIWDGSRQVTYAQRTVDNRLVFGARGSYLVCFFLISFLFLFYVFFHFLENNFLYYSLEESREKKVFNYHLLRLNHERKLC